MVELCTGVGSAGIEPADRDPSLTMRGSSNLGRMKRLFGELVLSFHGCCPLLRIQTNLAAKMPRIPHSMDTGQRTHASARLMSESPHFVLLPDANHLGQKVVHERLRRVECGLPERGSISAVNGKAAVEIENIFP